VKTTDIDVKNIVNNGASTKLKTNYNKQTMNLNRKL